MIPCHAADGDPIATLGKWYKSPIGRQVAVAEGICLERLLADVFGHYLLQIGCGGQFAETLGVSRIRHRILLGETLSERAHGVAAGAPANVFGGVSGSARPAAPGGGARVRATPFALPIATASIDAVLLPHTLDFSLDAHQVLREVERVLIPQGRLLLMGFNPLSAWGLLRALPRRRRRVPWCGVQLSPLRIADWLRLLGLQIEERQMLVFRPPLRRAYLRPRDWIEVAGARYWPLFGGVYVIRAVKRVSTLTPVRPRWRQRSPLLPGRAIEPTAREGNHG
ncbi:MAG: methyltransferase domain-containing protein [Chromatiaceae bacterium]|nr:MAG: methyltransferase domain-containing protein [Chromatiaceae bacterium]